MSTEAARLARLGAVLASASRARLLYALMGGTAHTQTELARHLGLAASTVSEHVGVLLDAGLVEVTAQGRHQRRDHLAGTVGDALLRRALEARWVSRLPTQPRALRLTAAGREALTTTFGLELP